MSVPEKYFSKNHKFYGTYVTTLIHYYKIEINYVNFISLHIFFISLQRIQLFIRFFAKNEKCKDLTSIVTPRVMSGLDWAVDWAIAYMS